MTTTTTATLTDRSAALAALEAGVQAIIDGAAFRAYLDVQAKLHTYSLNNVLLILHQRPTASRVAGYKAWQKLGRQVRKGEKGIKVFVPYRFSHTEKDDDGTETTTCGVGGFGLGTVFDISQTDGEPLPEPPSVAELTGETDSARGLIALLTAYLAGQGIPVSYSTDLGSVRGTWHAGQRTITVAAGMSAEQTAKTLAHEAVHAIAGHCGSTTDRQDDESVAECAAYLVLAHHGIATGAYSFGYVAAWAQDMAVFKRNISAARETANAIIAGVATPATTAGQEEGIARAA
jgi:antirestriction protein ArdC